MTSAPDRSDTRDQQIAELRTALQRTVQWLSFSAGRAASDDPAHAETVMAVVADLDATLARTVPR
ncbi:hypothetical protein [Streptomyces sp. NPDC060184]|uniref:hypothetical protein n=1 Tax=Streptomyces sp. NPDC060184 TaxID=3347064 RepID=UPI00365F4F97